MPETGYQVTIMLSNLVAALPIGTNVGLLPLPWMLVSGRLLTSRGALFPSVSDAGLTEAETRRAWAALAGAWSSAPLLAGWQARVAAAVARSAPDDVLVVDGGFGVALLQAAGATAFVARVAKNVTARRATPAPYGGRGRRPTRGALVRPLPRRYGGRFLPATPPDQSIT